MLLPTIRLLSFNEIQYELIDKLGGKWQKWSCHFKVTILADQRV